jgi:hypothetical protein
VTNAPNPYGEPSTILASAARHIADAANLVEVCRQATEWTESRAAVALAESESRLFRARCEVLRAIQAATFERHRQRQVQARRKKGIRPQSWQTRDPKTGRITGYNNTKETPIT